jgi:2-oxoglutarate ferredoxin oxidoreductase subunit beta
MIFGKERNQGIRLNGHQPEVVTVGEGGVTESDLLVHDETDPLIAFMLAHLWWPDFPVPVGVVRNIERPTHDQLITDQIAQATATRGAGDLKKLLNSGETWTVE